MSSTKIKINSPISKNFKDYKNLWTYNNSSPRPSRRDFSYFKNFLIERKLTVPLFIDSHLGEAVSLKDLKDIIDSFSDLENLYLYPSANISYSDYCDDPDIESFDLSIMLSRDLTEEEIEKEKARCEEEYQQAMSSWKASKLRHEKYIKSQLRLLDEDAENFLLSLSPGDFDSNHTNLIKKAFLKSLSQKTLNNFRRKDPALNLYINEFIVIPITYINRGRKYEK